MHCACLPAHARAHAARRAVGGDFAADRSDCRGDGGGGAGGGARGAKGWYNGDCGEAEGRFEEVEHGLPAVAGAGVGVGW